MIAVFKCIPHREHTDPFLKEIYRDVSKPEERQYWLPQPGPELFEYSVGAIHELDQIFSEKIMETDGPIDLLILMDEIKSCERLHPKLKENLYLNIRNKL